MAAVDINLTAKGDQVGEAWIWRLAKEFDIKVSIVKANIDEDFGWAKVRLEGPVEEIQRATAWLMTTGLHVEAEQRSVGS
ncbi:MAG TPA: NIL domain-containing protein [Fimbriimonadaceae bacterium]|nr:NIL domain-containing protein [Fimbriimonadaceae bacterium]